MFCCVCDWLNASMLCQEQCHFWRRVTFICIKYQYAGQDLCLLVYFCLEVLSYINLTTLLQSHQLSLNSAFFPPLILLCFLSLAKDFILEIGISSILLIIRASQFLESFQRYLTAVFTVRALLLRKWGIAISAHYHIWSEPLFPVQDSLQLPVLFSFHQVNSSNQLSLYWKCLLKDHSSFHISTYN